MKAVAAVQTSIEAAPSRRLAVLTIVGFSLVFLASVFFRPQGAGPLDSYFTICGFKNLTGLPCPGCGLTHSFTALANGDLVLAFAFNAMGPVLFLAFALLWLRGLLVLLNKPRPVAVFDATASRFRLVRNFVIAFGVFGVARILFLVFFLKPEGLGQSPVARFIARLFG